MTAASVDDRSLWQRLRAGELVLLSDRELLLVGVGFALVAALVVTLLLRFLEPPPPRRVVITTGGESGAYFAYANRYAKAFSHHGITLEVRPSRGSVENLARLSDPASGVTIGLVQSGIGEAARYPDLESLASVAHEPIWVFHKPRPGAAPVTSLGFFGGKSIAIGPDGSGTRAAALKLFEAHQIGAPETRFSDESGSEAVAAVIQGRVDAAFMVAAADAPSVRQALDAGLEPVSFERADAYVRLLPWLSKVLLPQGVVNLARDLPRQDVQLIAASANLVVRNDLHPAIAYLLMDVASDIHRGQTLANGPREFPNERQLDFPQSRESQRYFKNGRPFLQRYLPFWLANLLERFALTLLPALAIVIPLMRVLPGLLGWRELSRILKLYHEIEQLEARGELSPARRASAMAHLQRIETVLASSHLSARRSNEKYQLKGHLQMLRNRLTTAPDGPVDASRPG